jgi:tripartite-type tricarboxylate transporter receptor subunit TctC
VKFPTKPIELIVPFPAGGTADVMSRAIAEAAKSQFEQPMVVVNKAGGAATVGTEAVAAAKPDGHTLGTVSVGPAATQPHIDKVTYTIDSFEPLMMLYDQPLVLVVGADSKYKTAKELLDDAIARPGQLKFAAAPVGGVPHLGGELLLRMVKAKAAVLPFQGTGPATTALLGGHIDAATLPPGDVAANIEAGKLRALGIMSAERYSPMSSVPTMKEQGYNLVATAWAGVVAPKGVPAPVLDRLGQGLRKAVESKVFQDAAKTAYSPIGYVPPSQVASVWKNDFQQYGELIKSLKQEGVLQ